MSRLLAIDKCWEYKGREFKTCPFAWLTIDLHVWNTCEINGVECHKEGTVPDDCPLPQGDYVVSAIEKETLQMYESHFAKCFNDITQIKVEFHPTGE